MKVCILYKYFPIFKYSYVNILQSIFANNLIKRPEFFDFKIY